MAVIHKHILRYPEMILLSNPEANPDGFLTNKKARLASAAACSLTDFTIYFVDAFVHEPPIKSAQ